MNADRVKGFCEGMAITVAIAALGFVIIKEMDAFGQRRERRRCTQQLRQPQRYQSISTNGPVFDDFRITSHHPLEAGQIADLQAIIEEHFPQMDAQQTEGEAESDPAEESRAE